MTAARDRKQETRQRILAAASRGFRSHGYAGIGIDGIAKEAGVTSGAFYAHMGSKDSAFIIALELGLDEVIAALPGFRATHGDEWIKAFTDYYLGRTHRADIACGCAMASLSAEIGRFAPDVRALYEKKMTRITDVFADGLSGGDVTARRARAWAALSALIGGLIIARSVKSRATADSIADAVQTAALAAAGPAKA